MQKLVVGLVLACAFSVQAKTVYVSPSGTGTGEDWRSAASIQAALEDAEATELKLLAGDYPLTAALTVASGRNLKLVGGHTGVDEEIGAERSVFCRGADAENIRFLEATGATLLFENIAFTNALYVSSKNYTSYYGTALNFNNTAVTMRNCAVRENGGSAAFGMGVHYYGVAYLKGGSLTAENCDFSDNALVSSSAQSFIDGLAISGDSTSLDFRSCTFLRNRGKTSQSYTLGLAIYAKSSHLVVSNCTFAGNGDLGSSNSATTGGTINFSGTSYYRCEITDSVFEGNWLNKSGVSGGCLNLTTSKYYDSRYKYVPTLTRCVFKDNGKRPSDGSAGAASASDFGDVCIISSPNYPSIVTNCVFTGVPNGDALKLKGLVNVSRCTVAGAASGYGVNVLSGTTTLGNSIVWGNAGGGVTVAAGASFSATYCDIQEEWAGSGNISEDPRLSDDGYAHLLSEAGYYANGGFTGGTWAVADVTSPAIDKGDPEKGVGDETQPNKHLPNLGAYAGTAVASRSKLGSSPIVRPDELKVFAYEVTPGEGVATIRGEVASTGDGSATADVSVVWDSEDRGTSDVLAWANRRIIGGCAPWTLFICDMTDLSGRTVCRLVAENGSAVAFSDAIEFSLAEKATISAVSLIRIQRTTAFATAAISDNGGVDATLRVRACPSAGTEGEEKTFDFNFGLPVVAGQTYSLTLTGLEAGTEYVFIFEAVNGAGTASESLTRTTLSSAARTYYVSPTGAGDKDGASAESAFGSIQDAIDNATSAGDVISLAAGDYTVGQTAMPADLSNVYASGMAGVTLQGDIQGGTVFTIGGDLKRLVHAVNSRIAFTDITFRGGRLAGANSYGHGVFGESSNLSFVHCRFEDNGIETTDTNNKGHYGGAVAADGGSAVFSNCVFAANKIVANQGERLLNGAGVWSKNAALELVGCSFATNYVNAGTHAGVGGAVYAEGGSLLATNCTFVRNYVTHTRGSAGSAAYHCCYGGAVYLGGVSPARIVDCSFNGCYAHDLYEGTSCFAGGTIYATGANGVLEVSRCVFTRGGLSGESAYVSMDTGAVTLESGLATIDNTLFAGGHSNSVEVVGGTLLLRNVTIAGNDAFGVLQTGGTLAVTNSIVWANAQGGIGQTGGSQELGYSDIQGAAADAETHVMAKDPLLYGPTKKRAYRLRTASPCVGVGDATVWTATDTDLDGLKRLRNGKVDLGCYSFNAPGLMLMLK